MFTRQAEESFSKFTSPAVTVIPRSCWHRNEQTLIDASTVGVVVLESGLGAPTPLNRWRKGIRGRRDTFTNALSSP